MYINRTLLLVLAIAAVFTPSALEWVTSGGVVWYRAYLLWLAIIALAWWNNRSGYDDL
ncbi:MAG: hypothetical protein AAGI24_04420 [Pseudomonadota bacterium]